MLLALTVAEVLTFPAVIGVMQMARTFTESGLNTITEADHPLAVPAEETGAEPIRIADWDTWKPPPVAKSPPLQSASAVATEEDIPAGTETGITTSLT